MSKPSGLQDAQTPHQRAWAHLSNAAMIWLTGSMVTLALLALATVAGILLWTGGGWLFESHLEPAHGASYWDQLQVNLALLIYGSAEVTGSAAMLPAIVGTVLMIFLMTIVVAPLGVVVALYLQYYASDSWYNDLVRISIQNLAGVPSIVYGVFGLGFFVYVVGDQLDHWLFAEDLPKPTFGTPGLLWASLTLAMLTLPVVIVSAEEGFARLPPSLGDGSLALGATRAETIFYVLVPAASPSMLTGVILAIARAAGEVAPLMLVGVVKYAPTLPVNFQAPFIHLEQKFMHLGFLVYDLTLHAHPSEGRLGLVAATSLVLVMVVLGLNLTASGLRQRLRERYRQSGPL